VRLCDFPDCGRKHATKGLCWGHHKQRRDGRPLVALRTHRSPRSRVDIYDEFGNRMCMECEQLLPIEKFSDRGRYKNSRALSCASCVSLWTNFRLSWAAFQELIENAAGRCEICGTDDPGTGTRWNVDHDHGCCSTNKTCGKCVRGILCRDCNWEIARMDDDPRRLERAAEYIRRTTPRHRESA